MVVVGGRGGVNNALIKKKRKFSSYIRKFRRSGCKVIYNMTDGLLIYD
jgi:hypothetical protein